MMEKQNILNKLNLNSWIWIIGIIVLAFFTYIKFNPADFFRILIPILIAASFALLTVFALTEVRKLVKEYYSRETKNILRDIEGMKARQEHEEIDNKIETEREILSQMESLKGFKRNYFEKCVIYSSILFTIALLSTFINFGSYIGLSNTVIIMFFFFSGLFYFSKMIQAIFVALNIIRID
jgi:hypothetical protein